MNIKQELFIRAKAEAFDKMARAYGRFLDRKPWDATLEEFHMDMDEIFRDLGALQVAAERLLPDDSRTVKEPGPVGGQ